LLKQKIKQKTVGAETTRKQEQAFLLVLFLAFGQK
jgi:hypothetical protein